MYCLVAWGTRAECVKPRNTTLFAGKTVPQNTVAIVVSTSFTQPFETSAIASSYCRLLARTVKGNLPLPRVPIAASSSAF
jgi:hypothetical protein